MRLLATATIAATALVGLTATEAAAFNCAVPALVNPAKKTVCANPLLRAIDDKEESAFKALGAGLSLDARRALQRDRRIFVSTRDGCEADQRCLEATYRAQLRLYTKLGRCKVTRANQTFCVTTTADKHRQELHKSL